MNGAFSTFEFPMVTLSDYLSHREAGRMLKMNRKKNAVAGNNDQIGTVPRYTYAGSAAPNRVTGIPGSPRGCKE